MSGISLIVGLGNPTPQYEKTRHNAGFWFLDLLARRYAQTFNSVPRLQANLFSSGSASTKVLFLKPITYMNCSGRSVGAVANYYKIPPENILVAHDDLDFPAGVIRLKRNGGHGGHNGVRDIMANVGSKTFARLRIGVGRPADRQQVLNYVLKSPPASEKEAISTALTVAADQIDQIIHGDFDQVMNRLHSMNEA